MKLNHHCLLEQAAKKYAWTRSETRSQAYKEGACRGIYTDFVFPCESCFWLNLACDLFVFLIRSIQTSPSNDNLSQLH